jgi:DNA modification methylase
MSRVEHIGDATLYLGDCRDILPTLGKVDACVTDPPYGIGADSAMHKAGGTKHGAALAAKRHYAATDWDDQPIDASMIRALRDASKWQVIFGGNYFDVPPARCWLVWDKLNGANDFADCELAWTNLDKPVRRVVWMWNGMLRKGQEDRNEHPTQKPLGVMEWCINQLPQDVGMVLDPFMGSGTTGVACVRLDKRFIGIEREPTYFDIACRRISEAYRQPRLFAEPERKPQQLALLAADPSRSFRGGGAVIAALYVETDGCYAGLPGVDAWGGSDGPDGSTCVHRDAREYLGPHPVVAHPPCKRWGRFWHGSTRKPHQYELGDDGGCFMAALIAVHECGGVIEHPADSHAWAFFGLPIPRRGRGWTDADQYGGRSCYVEQGHYGHIARKGTWLYAIGVEFPFMIFATGEQRIHPRALELHGYEKARRIGVMAMCGGKDKTRLRNATPTKFRDLLLSIAQTARRPAEAA